MRSGYEFFDHTADIGLRAFGRDLAELFAGAGHGLLAVLETNTVPGSERELIVRLEADDRQELMLLWLKELLTVFDLQRVALSEFAFAQIDEQRLDATCHGLACDPDNPQSGPEVKAVTYHQLKVDRVPDGWMAEVILDI